MKRLSEHIETIDIGELDQLVDMAKYIDLSLQGISSATDRLASQLVKYSISNKGKTYEKIVNEVLSFRDNIFGYSEEMNDLQCQIVEYHNKVARYEEKSFVEVLPSPFNASKSPISSDGSVIQMHRQEMINLAATMCNYSKTVFEHTASIVTKKNDIASIWKDAQYRDFSAFIDEISREIKNMLAMFDEFVDWLQDKIRELD